MRSYVPVFTHVRELQHSELSVYRVSLALYEVIVLKTVLLCIMMLLAHNCKKIIISSCSLSRILGSCVTRAAPNNWEPVAVFTENLGVAEVLNLLNILELAEYSSSTCVFLLKNLLKKLRLRQKSGFL